MAPLSVALSKISWTEVLALIAAISGIGAFIIAWRDSQRNKRIIVRLSKLISSYTEDGKGPVYTMEVCFKNLGIEMQDISLCLGFRGPKGEGWFNVTIPASPESNTAVGSFMRGSVAKFVVTTRDKNVIDYLVALRDIKEQGPRLGLLTCSFLAAEFPLCSRFDWLKAKWNNLSYRLSFMRRMADGSDGHGVYKRYQLPYFLIPSQKLQFFISGLAKQEEKGQSK
jgi:hypothetical protein